ncbi:cytochrome p450 monooxygenase [Fusarium beomiforme]|uniref:Cytochrome p450 monooxygenase n=1 Tax=Fusarium beomiforme TaxID=44412 RepID=A0A9P5DRR0_9HYPO|nr:cytochrome p450 monooxygenase [Fusarium beomiforme]
MAQSPLPYLLALSTAYSSIMSHHWHCQLLPILLGSWAIVVATHLIAWLSWIYPYYVSELRHIPTVPGFPLWGQFFDIVSQECGVPQRQWHRQYGPIVRYFLPLGSERLSVAEESSLWRIVDHAQRKPHHAIANFESRYMISNRYNDTGEINAKYSRELVDVNTESLDLPI